MRMRCFYRHSICELLLDDVGYKKCQRLSIYEVRSQLDESG